jgi:hypothetical protein
MVDEFLTWEDTELRREINILYGNMDRLLSDRTWNPFKIIVAWWAIRCLRIEIDDLCDQRLALTRIMRES